MDVRSKPLAEEAAGPSGVSRGQHGRYPCWLCVTCGFRIPANQWTRHRRACVGRAKCLKCFGHFPCETRLCSEREKPVKVDDDVPGIAPKESSLRSLGMKAKRRGDGKWCVNAPWLRDAVVADTWEDAYWLAVKARET